MNNHPEWRHQHMSPVKRVSKLYRRLDHRRPASRTVQRQNHLGQPSYHGANPADIKSNMNVFDAVERINCELMSAAVKPVRGEAVNSVQ